MLKDRSQIFLKIKFWEHTDLRFSDLSAKLKKRYVYSHLCFFQVAIDHCLVVNDLVAVLIHDILELL